MARGDRTSWTATLARCFLAGATGGWLLLVAGLLRHGASTFDLLPSAPFALWVTLRSLALYGLLGGLLGISLGMSAAIVLRAVGRERLAPVLVLATAVAVVVVANLSAWWQLETLAGVPLDDPSRWAAAWRHLAYGLAAGAATAVIGARVGRAMRHRRATSGPAAARAALATGVALLLLLAAIDLGPLGLRRAAAPGTAPSQIAIIGLDGVTLRVLGPLLRAGELPTFARLVEEGAWGGLLTYGVASSPLVWTSVATGKRARDHGITDFVTHRGTRGYRPRTMKSHDWRARPVWDLLGQAGHQVAVVNWLMTAPPRPVRGAIVTRLIAGAKGRRAEPPELEPEIAAVLARPRPYDLNDGGDDDGDDGGGGGERAELLSVIDNAFDVAELLLAREPVDFLALYQSATDAAEHRFWRFYQPSRFDPALWGSPPPEAGELATLVPDTYARVDARLGALLARLDDDALVLVLSDHGQRAAAQPRLRPRLDRLLAALGFAALDDGGAGDAIDPRRSVAYPLIETPWRPDLRINLNLAGREPDGTVAPADYRRRVEEVAAALRAVRFADGEPFFARVEATRRPAPVGGSDITLLLGHRARDPRAGADGRDAVTVGDRALPLRRLVEIDVTISGDHDRQGVLFVHGPMVRRGPIGQRVLDTAFQELLRPLTDRIDALDRWLPLLGRLGLIERATTLDPTPTVLHAAGLPIGRDMAGRPLVELLDAGLGPPRWVDTWERAAPTADTPEEEREEGDAEELERLRALGYVN